MTHKMAQDRKGGSSCSYFTGSCRV